MKKNYLFLLFVVSFSLSYGADLKVIIEKLHSHKGGVALALFDEKNKEHFPANADKSLLKQYKKIEENLEVEFIFKDLPDGNYAAFAFHDEDGNFELNKNFIGIPKEGYGASREAINRFGPPKFDDAKFDVKNSKEQAIKIVY